MGKRNLPVDEEVHSDEDSRGKRDSDEGEGEGGGQ